MWVTRLSRCQPKPDQPGLENQSQLPNCADVCEGETSSATLARFQADVINLHPAKPGPARTGKRIHRELWGSESYPGHQLRRCVVRLCWFHRGLWYWVNFSTASPYMALNPSVNVPPAPTAAGYGLMTQMAKAAINTLNLTLQGGYLRTCSSSMPTKHSTPPALMARPT
jgi:hypothetical protein